MIAFGGPGGVARVVGRKRPSNPYSQLRQEGGH
jgi:hypothetical protein